MGPSYAPSFSPSLSPSSSPTDPPSASPSSSPTDSPSASPSSSPTDTPTSSQVPSAQPSFIFDDKTLKPTIDDWFSEPGQVEEDYGPMKDWNIRKVTTLNGMFYRGVDKEDYEKKPGVWLSDEKKLEYEALDAYAQIVATFNEDVSKWNTEGVTNMRNVFRDCVNFNQDISGWNVDKVTTMISMFNNAKKFNADISGWNTSKVAKMQQMFEEAYEFNIDISGWDTSQNENTGNMFLGTKKFNFDISKWNMGKVTRISYMFDSAEAFNQNLCPWVNEGGLNLKDITYVKQKNKKYKYIADDALAVFGGSLCPESDDPKCNKYSSCVIPNFCHKC